MICDWVNQTLHSLIQSYGATTQAFKGGVDWLSHRYLCFSAVAVIERRDLRKERALGNLKRFSLVGRSNKCAGAEIQKVVWWCVLRTLLLIDSRSLERTYAMHCDTIILLHDSVFCGLMHLLGVPIRTSTSAPDTGLQRSVAGGSGIILVVVNPLEKGCCADQSGLRRLFDSLTVFDVWSDSCLTAPIAEWPIIHHSMIPPDTDMMERVYEGTLSS